MTEAVTDARGSVPKQFDTTSPSEPAPPSASKPSSASKSPSDPPPQPGPETRRGASVGRKRADESVATKFTRLMKATTSRYGVLTDPLMVGASTAPLVLATVVVLRVADAAVLSNILLALIFAPLLVAIVTTLRLGVARDRLVDWLATLPFGLDNMNAILNGLGEEFEVVFQDGLPERAELNDKLEAVHGDSFITNIFEDRKTIEIRIGVVENKYNPSGSNFARFARCQELIQTVLVPLSSRFAIENVRIK